MKTDLTHEFVVSNIIYDPDTGIFKWKVPGKGRIMSKELGSDDGEGYLQMNYNYRKIRLNRLAWFYMTGEWPNGIVDHINKIKNDNRWKNLRIVTNSQSQMNRNIHSNNKSGYKNISRKNNRNLWVVQIYKQGKKVVEKCFKDLDDAIVYRDSIIPTIHGEYYSL